MNNLTTNRMKFISSCIVFNFVMSVFTFSYGQNKIEDYLNKNRFKEFKRELNDVEISINPLIEYLQIINLVGGNPAINSTEMDYKLEIINFFKEHKNHPAFNYLRSNWGKFFNSIDAPYGLFLSLKNDFTFREDLVNNRWQNKEGINEFLNVFKTFFVEADFVKFFNSQAEYYELVLANTAFTLKNFDEKKRMLNYFGVKNPDKHEFYLILNFLGFGNFGKGIQTKNNEEHYAIISPNSGNGILPIFDKNEALALIWHEFGHSFSNPLVDKYWEDFTTLSHLNEPIKQSMEGQAYSSWHTVVYEHMVRAITCRLGAGKYSEEFAEVNLNRLEIGKKFIYTIPIISALKEYEKNRDKYPALDNFMPNIINALKVVNQENIDQWLTQTQQTREPDIPDIPTNGKIYECDNRLIILATCEKDTAANKRLRQFVTQRHQSYQIVDDTTALKMELADYNLFVIGTPWGNKFMEKHIKSLPFKITKENLIAKNVYEGNGYAFMTGWINPFNPNNLMVIYAAQNPDDLINFDWVPRGSTDYQIVKNLITLKADNYKRYNKIWGCY